jgi:hypothetical protein
MELVHTNKEELKAVLQSEYHRIYCLTGYLRFQCLSAIRNWFCLRTVDHFSLVLLKQFLVAIPSAEILS